MNPINRIPAEKLGTIQYSRALSTKHADAETPMSLVKTQAFRVPWGPPKHRAQHSPSEAAARERVDDQLSGTPAPIAATEKPKVLLVFPEERAFESSDYILEDLRQRAQAKTSLMEEALQRCEWYQRRFWGINE